jgi:hypothetical protein
LNFLFVDVNELSPLLQTDQSIELLVCGYNLIVSLFQIVLRKMQLEA